MAAVALVLDFLTKEWALAAFREGESIQVVGDLLRFTLIFNPGAAFSIGTGMTWVFTLITMGVAIYILTMARRLRSLPWALSLGLILGGALGNLVDRLFRPPSPLHGHVVDWIQLPNWPVFNLADSSLVAGSALAVLLAFRGINIDGTREGDGDGGSGEEAESESTAASTDGPAPADGPVDTGGPAAAEGATAVPDAVERPEDGAGGPARGEGDGRP